MAYEVVETEAPTSELTETAARIHELAFTAAPQAELTGHDFSGPVFRDEFNDADGVHLAAHTPDINIGCVSWDEEASGYAVIAGGMASPAGNVHAVIDTHSADGVIRLTPYGTTADYRMSFRFLDVLNYWYFIYRTDGSATIYQRISGTAYSRATGTLAPRVEGRLMKVIMDGDDISCLVGTDLVCSYDACTSRQTRHGLYMLSGSDYKVGDFVAWL